MVLTEAEILIMKTDSDDGMAMSTEAVKYLDEQGYKNPKTMVDLKDTAIDSLFKSATYSQWIEDPKNAGQKIKGPPVNFSHNSAERLKKFVKGLKFYEAVGRQITPGLVEYKMMQIIADQFEYLKEADPEDMPIHGKNECPIRFMARFRAYLMTVLSGRRVPVPLSYVIRDNKEVAVIAPTLATGLPYSEEHGTVADELIARVSHHDPLFKNDNMLVMTKFLAAMQNSPLLSCIKPFERKRDGRGAVLAFEAMHCGHDKQEARVRNAEKLLNTMKFTGLNPNHTLETLATIHRRAYSDMAEAVDSGIKHQLPNDTTRARLFRDAITCKDPDLVVALADCKKPDSSCYDSFEKTVTRLVRDCPVARLRNSGGDTSKRKRPQADISEVEGGVAATSKVVYLPNTGIAARYYTNPEWKQLSDAQRDELSAYRRTSPAYSTMIRNKMKADKSRTSGRPTPPRDGTSRKKMRMQIASLQKQLEKHTKAQQDADTKQQDEALYNTLVEDVATKLSSTVSALQKQQTRKGPTFSSVSALLQQRKEAEKS